MTVQTINPNNDYVGDGATLIYPFTFQSLEAAWVSGIVDGVQQTGSVDLNSDQDLAPGGTFTFDVAPGSGVAVSIIRQSDLLQGTDYAPFTPFPAKDHEEALDKLTMITQQLNYDLSFALKTTPPNGTPNLTLPEPEALKYVRWKSDLSGFENVDLAANGAPTTADLVSLEINNTVTDVEEWANNLHVDDIAELRSNLAADTYGIGAVVYVRSTGGKPFIVETAGLNVDDGGSTVVGGDLAAVRARDGKVSANAYESSGISAALLKNTELGGGLVYFSDTYSATSTVLVDGTPEANKHNISGSKKGVAKIEAAFDGVLIYARENFNFENFSVAQTATANTGRAFSTSNTKQTAYNTMQSLDINDFRFGIWKRYSLWDSYRDLRITDNTCGIRLARSDYDAGNANAEAPGGWNLDPGWFHNALSFDNIYIESGEVGIWAPSVCAAYNNLTCQNQATDGSSNDVLPSGQAGTGLFLDSGSDSSVGLNTNVINSYYTENNRVSLHVKNQRHVQVNGMFCQGRASDDRAVSAIIADKSNVEVNGFVGSDFFTDVFEARNGGTLWINSAYGPYTSINNYTVDATSKIKMRGTSDKGKYEYELNKPITDSYDFVLPEIVPAKSHAKLYLSGLSGGASVKVGEMTIINWNSAIATFYEWVTSAPTAVTVSVSNGGAITITLAGANEIDMFVVLDIVGGDMVSGTSTVIAGTLT